MNSVLYPPIFLLLGAVVVGLLRGRARQVAYVAFPVLGLINVLLLQRGSTLDLDVGVATLDLVRADKLALVFGYLFSLAAIITAIYSIHVRDRVQLVSGMLYAGAAIGAVFAGDLITLFIYWELLAVTSVFLIWARRSKRSPGSGIRYLIMHVASGLLLLAGAAFQYSATGSLAFTSALSIDTTAGLLIFLSFGIKCAFPFLHTWLVDSYPESTPTGAVYLCCFTTKCAVYAMARGYEGTEILITIGAVMAMFPIFFAVIENDLRRVLGYSMINQVGFMMVGIGIGGLGLNGAVAHAFNDVLFKGLLFMSMGAVLYRTGRINGSDLGGLYKTMPWTMGFCMVGAASISAFPLFCGFVSKSMVMSAAGAEGHILVWLALLFAAAGVFHHAGIKIPYFAFFAHDSGLRPKEAPINMRIAMGISASLCILVGCFPGPLYSLLPADVPAYHPYDLTHVVTQTQILFFSALAFVSLMLLKIYPPELRSTNLDADWFYRKGSRLLYRGSDLALNSANRVAHRVFVQGFTGKLNRFFNAGPARLLVLLMVPYWRVQGASTETVNDRKRELYEQARLGAFPVGVTAFLAVVLLASLFFF
jgi:multicomponent Na+:H+ antiporter subunit D